MVAIRVFDVRLMLLSMSLLAAACAGTTVPPEEPHSQLAPSTPQSASKPVTAMPAPTVTFGDDVNFMQQHTKLIVLRDSQRLASIAVAPDYQGRVMTSSAVGDSGASFGWINRELIASKTKQPHMNAFGGEDRFWLGPEGGQYGLYFAPDAPFDLEHWQVPEALDWEAWPVTGRSDTEVSFEREMTMTNYAGTAFFMRVERRIRLLNSGEVDTHLGAPRPKEVSAVAYESINTITNRSIIPWTKTKGLPSIWILGTYQPSPSTTVVIPVRKGADEELGPVVNDAYFGEVPADRLVASDGVVYFRGDGQQRGKIGIPRPRALPTLGSYDPAQQTLTLVRYTLPDDAQDYVNSAWEQQEAPYSGDVVNSYNDGPLGEGQKPLGPFYELETSSPAAALTPGQSMTHTHCTIHLQGPKEFLDPIAKRQLGVSLAQIEQAFSKSE